MGHQNDAPLESAQRLLQPSHHLAVQMVGGLVQDQHVGGMDQSRRQSHPLALASGQGADLGLKVGDAQPGQNCLALVLLQGPELRRMVEKDLLQHRGPVLHLRILGQIGDLHIGVPGQGALIGLLHPGQNLEQCALSSAVDSDDTDLLALLQIEGHIMEQLFGSIILGDVLR